MLRSTTLALTLLLLASSLCAQLKTEIFKGQEVAPNEVLVKFKSNALIAQSLPHAKLAEDIDVAEQIGPGNVMRFHSRSKNVTRLVNELSIWSDILYAEP